MKRVPTVAILLLVLALLSALPAPGQDQSSEFPDDTVALGLGSDGNVAVAIEFSQVTFADDGAATVLIGRDDVFADSLASGVAQDESPLLLVPRDGPVPAAVMTEVERLGADSAIVLGGEAAVSQGVVDALEADGLAVRRLSGPTRVETAIDVARFAAPASDTVILARAAGVDGNPTSGFADALAAGGWAAEMGWPVLLTESDRLTETTATYLAESGVGNVHVVGGTAAVGQEVVDQLVSAGMTVERVAGASRAATAVEIAKARGSETAAEAAQVILVDGFSEDAWAAGFAAAALSAQGTPAGVNFAGVPQPSPIVLGNIDVLPPETDEWLTAGTDRLVCAVTRQVCELGRVSAGFDPALAVAVPPGSVLYLVADDGFSGVMAAAFDGTPVGLALRCATPACSDLDVTDDGDALVVLEPQRGVFSYTGEVFGSERTSVSWDEGTPTNQIVSIDVITEPNGNDLLGMITVNNVRLRDRISQAGQRGSGGCACERFPSFQALGVHPDFADGISELLLLEGGDLGINVPFSGATQPGVQRRPGSQILGAAMAPDATGDVAIVDVIGGEGLLRIADLDGGIIEVDGVDAASTPYWLAGDQSLAVLADTADGVSLVVVDRANGRPEIVVDDAGDAAGGRISGDASGTFIAWQTAGDVRIWDSRDDSVAVVEPPAGMTLRGGPVFRP